MGGKVGKVGKYRLIERLGEGGQAEVWKAKNKKTKEFVALKCCLVTDANDEIDHAKRNNFI